MRPQVRMKRLPSRRVGKHPLSVVQFLKEVLHGLPDPFQIIPY